MRCYLFILCGEVRPVQLVDGHHDRHHVLTVHDGDGEDVLGLIVCQLVHKVAEMRALRMRKQDYSATPNCLLSAPAPTSRLNFDERTSSIHKRCEQELSII